MKQEATASCIDAIYNLTYKSYCKLHSVPVFVILSVVFSFNKAVISLQSFLFTKISALKG
jgi:hypothetical protein